MEDALTRGERKVRACIVRALKYWLYLFFVSVVANADVSQPALELWERGDGSEFKARLLSFTERLDKNKKKVKVAMMAGDDGLIQAQPFSGFSPESLERIERQRLVMVVRKLDLSYGQLFPPVAPTGWQYVPIGRNDRSFIPTYNQTDYGYKAGSCVPNSLVNTLSWWDESKMVKFPQERNAHKQVDWLHTIISRESRTRNSGTSWVDLTKGMRDFEQKFFKGTYQFPCYTAGKLTPEKLAFFTQSNWALCLHVDVYYGSKYSGGHGVTLVSADKQGRVAINTWGMRFEGVLKKMKPKHGVPAHKQPLNYEIEFSNLDSLPSRIRDRGVRFTIEESKRAAIRVFIPLEKYKEGMKWNPMPQQKKIPLLKSEERALAVVKKQVSKPTTVVNSGSKKLDYHWVKKDDTAISFNVLGVEWIQNEAGKMEKAVLVVDQKGVIQRLRISDFRPSAHWNFRQLLSRRDTSMQFARKLYKDLAKQGHGDRYMVNYGYDRPLESGWMKLESSHVSRDTIPMVKLEDCGAKPGPSVNNAIVNTLLWWEKNGVLTFPETQTKAKKYQALHKLANLEKTVGIARLNWENVAKSMFLLGLKTLDSERLILCYSDFGQIYGEEALLKAILPHLNGNKGVCLGVSLLKDAKVIGHQALVVTGVNEDNSINAQAWGVKLKLRCAERVLDLKNRQAGGSVFSYLPLEVVNSEALPDWYKDRQLEMAFHDKGDSVKVLVPYKKVKVSE